MFKDCSICPVYILRLIRPDRMWPIPVALPFAVYPKFISSTGSSCTIFYSSQPSLTDGVFRLTTVGILFHSNAEYLHKTLVFNNEKYSRAKRVEDEPCESNIFISVLSIQIQPDEGDHTYKKIDKYCRGHLSLKQDWIIENRTKNIFNLLELFLILENSLEA